MRWWFAIAALLLAGCFITAPTKAELDYEIDSTIKAGHCKSVAVSLAFTYAVQQFTRCKDEKGVPYDQPLIGSASQADLITNAAGPIGDTAKKVITVPATGPLF